MKAIGVMTFGGPEVLHVFDLPPKQAADAHRRFQAGGVRGRLVLDFTT